MLYTCLNTFVCAREREREREREMYIYIYNIYIYIYAHFQGHVGLMVLGFGCGI